MRIYSMTATFGKLEHTTLTLEPGLNVIHAPNEWGKSTWCAFLVAMLYGIDSRVHGATKTALADKARFDPWSGQLMSGRIALNWQGRDITIERSSTKRSQFREFKAYETLTGLPVAELTADNCGQMLLGVEKEVFQRAGFIRLTDLPVTQSDALRRRLNALVTTGDESGAADRLATQLNKLKNECRANRSKGLLPQAEAQREEIAGKLRQLDTLHAEAQSLARRQAQLEQEHNALLAQQEAQSQAAAQTRAQTLEQLQQLRQERADAEMAHRQLQPPTLPEAFEGLSEAAATEQLHTDLETHAQACKDKHDPLGTVLTLLPAVLGVLCLLIPHWIRWVILLAGIAASIVLFVFLTGRQKRAAATAGSLRRKYDDLPAEQWAGYVQSLLSAQARYQQSLAQHKSTLTRLEHAISRLEQSLDAPVPAGVWANLAERLRSCEQQLRQNHMQQGRCQGQIAALGDTSQLQPRLTRLEARIESLKNTMAAIELAQTTLSQATAQLQSRFAPRITQRASELFSRLTGGRYQRLSLTQELNLQTCTEDEDTLRSILWRSDGTADQLYLALRLAVAGELTPEAPLVLDDALVRFDDDRLKVALEVLKEEAQRKQVILFTCHSREEELLK